MPNNCIYLNEETGCDGSGEVSNINLNRTISNAALTASGVQHATYPDDEGGNLVISMEIIQP